MLRFEANWLDNNDFKIEVGMFFFQRDLLKVGSFFILSLLTRASGETYLDHIFA